MLEYLLLVAVLAVRLDNCYGAQVDPEFYCSSVEFIADTPSTPPCQFNEGDGTVYVYVKIFQDDGTDDVYDFADIYTTPDPAPGATMSVAGGNFYPVTEVVTIVSAQNMFSFAAIPITLIDGTAVEGDNTFVLNVDHILMNLMVDPCGGTCGIVIEIVDNDPVTVLPTVSLDECSYVVDEGGTGAINIVRGADGGVDVDVSVTVRHLTAELPADFNLDTTTAITVASGAMTPVTVSGSVDGIDEGGEEVFEISITLDAAYSLGTPSKATVYIRDVAGAAGAVLPTVTLDECSYVVDEGGMGAINIVRGADGGAGDVAVAVTVRDLTAEMATDFSLDMASVMVGSGAMTPVTVSGSVDGTDEGGEEVFEISITPNAVVYTVGTPSKATVYIRDVDAAGGGGATLPTVSLDECSYVVNEGGDVEVNIVNGGVTAVDVVVEARDLTAVDGTDFSLDATTVTVPGGMMAPVTISGMTDDTDEGGEEVFEISIVSNAAYTVGTPSKATVYVRDTTGASGGSGTTSTPTYTIEHCDYKADESQSTFTFNIKRSATGSVETITFSTRDVSTTGGSDYEVVNGETVTFAADSDTAVASITILTDASTEDPEVFEITIANPSVGVLGDVTKAVVNLFDSMASQSEFCLGNGFSVMESSGSVEITVHRKGDVSQAGSVVLYTSNVDATTPNDYGITNERVLFGANQLSATVRVPLVDDNLIEISECFQVTISQPSGGVLCTQTSATVTIKDNDCCFSLESRYYIAPESSEPLDICVIKMGYLGGDSSVVNFQTIPGTAEQNADFTGVSTSLEFGSDVPIMCVPGLTITEDAEYEAQEQFTVSISAADSSRICEPSTATVMIKTSDPLCSPACVNNGVCTAENTCVCPSGYTGDICEQMVCPTNFCVNGGTCLTTATSYSCQCADGFQGSQCEQTSGGLSGGAIAGIAIGSAVGLATLGITIMIILMMRAQRASPSKAQRPTLNNSASNGGAIFTDGTMMQYPYQPDIRF